MAEELYSATGKRKTSVARIWMKPGNGEIRINKKTAEEYLVREADRITIMSPLQLAQMPDNLIYT